jgi:hypothetical protein
MYFRISFFLLPWQVSFAIFTQGFLSFLLEGAQITFREQDEHRFVKSPASSSSSRLHLLSA